MQFNNANNIYILLSATVIVEINTLICFQLKHTNEVLFCTSAVEVVLSCTGMTNSNLCQCQWCVITELMLME